MSIRIPDDLDHVEAVQALQDIHRLLDGEEFSADTCDEIAQILGNIGMSVRDPEDAGGDMQDDTTRPGAP